MNVDELAARLETLAQSATEELAQASSREAAIQIKNRYLGRKGSVQDLMGVLRDLPHEDRRQAGQATNQCKTAIEAAFDAKMEDLARLELERRMREEALDITLPGRAPTPHLGHPLRQIEAELIQIFTDMGFDVAEGPEIETDFYNFEALNFPQDHPARDMQDTFALTDSRLLRTHTSPVQIRTMFAYEPPIRIISPGRVYRCDSDITHSPVFHQIEGLLIDKEVSFADLKGTLATFVERCFGQGIDIRFRPSFFPFTEPSAEVDIECIFCAGEGCRVCSNTGWLEILGAGMVDPEVLIACSVDPEEYGGFAFGMGIERIAMLRQGVGDIRRYFTNDLRFLEQF